MHRAFLCLLIAHSGTGTCVDAQVIMPKIPALGWDDSHAALKGILIPQFMLTCEDVLSKPIPSKAPPHEYYIKNTKLC